MKRIGFDILLAVSVLFLPWWASVIIGGVGMFLFPVFWEAILAALIIDLLFSAPLPIFFNFHFVLTIGMLIAFAGMYVFKQYLR